MVREPHHLFLEYYRLFHIAREAIHKESFATAFYITAKRRFQNAHSDVHGYDSPLSHMCLDQFPNLRSTFLSLSPQKVSNGYMYQAEIPCQSGTLEPFAYSRPACNWVNSSQV